jgi:hypothetical protein
MAAMYAKMNRFGLAILSALMAAAAGLSCPAHAQTETLISGFNGDLSSSLGVNWTFENGFTGEFVPALSEGTGALKLYANGTWQIGLKLVGGAALANLIIANDTLELDAVGDFGMNYRQIVAVFNMNYPSPSTGFHQSAEVGLPVPSETEPFTHVVFDLTNVNNKNWKELAQGWLADPNVGGAGSWCELMIVINGDDLPQSADFDFDTDVDANDFLIWQRNVGLDFASQEQGDSNGDLIVDQTDFFDWQFQYGRRVADPPATIDNIKFVDSTPAAAVPEPATVAAGLAGAVSIGALRRRRRR